MHTDNVTNCSNRELQFRSFPISYTNVQTEKKQYSQQMQNTTHVESSCANKHKQWATKTGKNWNFAANQYIWHNRCTFTVITSSVNACNAAAPLPATHVTSHKTQNIKHY